MRAEFVGTLEPLGPWGRLPFDSLAEHPQQLTSKTQDGSSRHTVNLGLAPALTWALVCKALSCKTWATHTVKTAGRGAGGFHLPGSRRGPVCHGDSAGAGCLTPLSSVADAVRHAGDRPERLAEAHHLPALHQEQQADPVVLAGWALRLSPQNARGLWAGVLGRYPGGETRLNPRLWMLVVSSPSSSLTLSASPNSQRRRETSLGTIGAAAATAFDRR